MQVLYGPNISNPGNGDYEVWATAAAYSEVPRAFTPDPRLNRPPAMFSTMTVVQPEPAPLSGLLTFTLGGFSAAINLAGGQRFLSVVGPVPMVFLTVSGTSGERWSLLLR
jgi:hypothetical protein